MIKVLYCDDEPALLDIGKLFLERSGELKVETALSGQSAILMLKDHAFDVIVSDYQMPGMDGIELLKYIRKKCQGLPFILFTGRGREEIVIEAINNGVDFYLQKGGDSKAQFAELEHKIKLAVNRHRTDKTNIHFNRLYAVLSGVNATIVRAKTQDQLFSDICRIVVEEGRFTMAWIGLVDHTSRTIVPVAHFGFEEGYLKSVQISIDDNPLGQGPSGRAVRESVHVIYNDIVREPRMEPWYAETGKRGYRSTGAFPLYMDNTLIGVLQLYSLEENFFSDGEIRLLDEVASDISFAIERMMAEERKVQTEASLQESEEKLAAVVSGSPVPKFVIDRNHKIIYWNHALEVSTGISAEQVIGTKDQWRAFYNEKRPTMADLILDGAFDRIHELYAGKESESSVVPGSFDVIDFFPNIGIEGKWLRFMAAPIKNDNGVMLGAVETLIDISDIKRAEVELGRKNEELQAAFEEITATEEELRANLDELTSQERALQESEQRYRNIVEDQTEFICRFLPDGTHVFVNDAYCRYFGVDLENILGHRFSPALYPKDRKAVAAFFATLTPQKPVGTIDHRIIMPDGTVRWQRWSDRAIFNEKGNVVEYQSVGRDITEYKEVEERYRNIVEDQTEFICRFLPDGTHVFVNDAYCRYFGVDMENILGHRFSPALYPKDRKAVAAFFATLTPQKPVGTIDHRIIMPDGTVRWQRWSDRAIFNEKGNVVEYQSVGRDITEYKELEEQLQTTSIKYKELLENITDVYYRSDKNGRLVLASQSWARLLGYTDLSECIGKNIAQTFYADTFERSRFLEEVYQNGSVIDYEVTLKKKDGSPVTVATSSYLYFDAAGNVLGVEGTFRDITERKRITEVLKETERRLTDIINFLPDATFAIDHEGKVIAWNHAIEELTGMPAKDMIGKGNYEYALPFYGVRRPILIDLIATADSELEKNYSSVRRKGNVLTAETGLAHLSGKDLILWGKASPLYNSRNEVIGAIESIRDFTERRMLEDSLKQVNKKLNLMSSITRHDILNNIMVCLGYLELSKYKSPNPEMQKLIEVLEQNIGAIQSQIEFTRVYQDLGVAAPVWQNVGIMLQKCSAAQKIPVTSEISNLEVYADPLIGKVFYNLHDNAVRHGEHATKIHVRAEEQGKDMIIVWEDNGVGVLLDDKEKIFDRGYGRNTGLGLFLVREILGITGISIHETGEPGKGARFEILLPPGNYRSIPAIVPGSVDAAARKDNPEGGSDRGQ